MRRQLPCMQPPSFSHAIYPQNAATGLHVEESPLFELDACHSPPFCLKGCLSPAFTLRHQCTQPACRYQFYDYFSMSYMLSLAELEVTADPGEQGGHAPAQIQAVKFASTRNLIHKARH